MIEHSETVGAMNNSADLSDSMMSSLCALISVPLVVSNLFRDAQACSLSTLCYLCCYLTVIARGKCSVIQFCKYFPPFSPPLLPNHVKSTHASDTPPSPSQAFDSSTHSANRICRYYICAANCM